MPTLYAEHAEHPPTLAVASFARSMTTTEAYIHSSRSSRLSLLGRYSELRLGSSLPGDRTANTPSLRRDTKVRNRLDLPAYAYLLQPQGRLVQLAADGSVDLAKTLAVLTQYRYIIASRREVN